MGETERRGGTVLELHVAPGDLGRVIGRQGRTAAALRTLLQRRERNVGQGVDTRYSGLTGVGVGLPRRSLGEGENWGSAVEEH